MVHGVLCLRCGQRVQADLDDSREPIEIRAVSVSFLEVLLAAHRPRHPRGRDQRPGCRRNTTVSSFGSTAARVARIARTRASSSVPDMLPAPEVLLDPSRRPLAR